MHLQACLVVPVTSQWSVSYGDRFNLAAGAMWYTYMLLTSSYTVVQRTVVTICIMYSYMYCVSLYNKLS